MLTALAVLTAPLRPAPIPDLKAQIKTIEASLKLPAQPKWDEFIAPQLKRRDEQIAEAKRKADEAATAKAAQAAAEAATAQFTPPSPISVTAVVGALTGSHGYALAGGNCVNQVPPSLRGQGNPITWPATTQTPYIGAAALWYFNHTGRVVGIWSNGDLEIAHENVSGWGQTRFPRSAFRGFR